MASIRRSPRSRHWEARYRSPDGVQRTKGGFKTKSDARAFAATVEHNMRYGEWRPPELDKVTVHQWVDHYLAGATNKRESTLRRDRAVLRDYLLPSLAHVPIRQVRALDIKHIIEPLAATLAPATIRGIYGVIAATFRAAVDADVVSATPCKGVKRPTEHPTRKRFLSVEELETLADAIDPDYRAFVVVKGTLGLRFSEMAGLQVGDVDFFRRQLSVQRTIAEVGGVLSVEEVKSPASRRTIGVPQFVIDELSVHLRVRPTQPTDWVFESPRGGPLRYSAFHRRTWAPAVAAAGLGGLKMHGLRHSAAALMIETGAHPKAMQQRLGHASITTTLNVYGALLPSVDESVTQHLDELFAERRGAAVVQGGAAGSAPS